MAIAVTIALLLTAPLALAFDKAKAAETMAQQASSAYERGEYERAAELYANAWHTDGTPNYLYGQARAEQLAGKMDAADQHLNEFIALPNAPADRVAKAKDLLEQLRQARVDTRIAEGEAAARSGDLKLAAQIWADLAQKPPGRPDLYYRVGVALQQAGDARGAEQAFDNYLRQAPADAPDRSQAKVRRDALAEKRETQAKPSVTEPVQPAKTESTVVKPVADPGLAVTEPVEHPTAVTGWVVTAGGAALALGGLGLYLATRSDITAFQADTATNSAGKIAGIDQQTAQTRHDSIQNREIAAVAMGGVGVALVGVGSWLIVRTPGSHVAVTPGPTGLGAGLAWRF